MLGISADGAAGRGLGELRMSDATRSQWREAMATAQRTESPAPARLLLTDGFGQSGPWSGLCAPLGTAQPGSVLTLLRPPNASDLAPPDGASLLQLFLDALPSLAYIKDDLGRYVWVNKAMQEMFDLAPEEWPGRTVYDIQTADEAEVVAEVDKEIVASGQPRQADFTVSGPNGGKVHRRSFRVPFVDAAGRRLLAGISLDVTSWVEAMEQREALLKELEGRNNEIREHSLLLESVLNSLDQGVVVFDNEGHVLVQNRKWYEIAGRESGGGGLVLPDFTTLDGRALKDDERLYHRVMRGDVVKGEEYFMLRRDGGKRQLVVGGMPLHDSEGAIRYVICTFLDVTEVRRLERTREELLKILSHDLRTPLAVVSAGSQLIQQFPATSEVVLGSANRIKAAAQRMSSMIEDLLESASLENGSIELRRQPLDLRQLVCNVIEDHRNALEVERIVLQVCEGETAVCALVDRDRIVRALLNLLTNALKYSDPPQPVVIKVGKAKGEAVIEVIDQGAGMAPEDQRRLFEPYYRTPGSPKGGLGLGLYIVKGLIEAHGGRVWIRSTRGCGTCAGFALPLAQ